MGEKCLKVTLMSFNIICLMGGIAMLSCGLLITYEPTLAAGLAALGGVGTSTTLMGSLAYAMVALGGIIILVSFIGCCGAVSESKCMIGLYFILILLLFIGQLVIGILGIVNGKQGVRDALSSTMTEYAQTYQQNKKSLDIIHESMKCCGPNGTQIYWKRDPVMPITVTTTAKVTNNVSTTTTVAITTTPALTTTTVLVTGSTSNTTTLNTNQTTVGLVTTTTPKPRYPYWPDSCCKRDSTGGFVNLTECHDYNQQNSTILDQYVNTAGCVDKLSQFIDRNLVILGACAVALAVIELFAIIVSCKLYKTFD